MDRIVDALYQVYYYYFNLETLKETMPLLITKGLPVVIEVLAFSLVFSFIWGLILALLRLSRFRILRWLSGAYIDLFRGLPLLLLLVYTYLGLGIFAARSGLTFLRFPPVPAAVLAITLCYGAYSAEIFRAGIQSIHHGQMEAARSLGMSYGQAMRYVILPQALKVVVPPLTNELIAMIKDTSLTSTIAVAELLFLAKEKMGRDADPTALTAAAIVYVIFTIPLIRLATRLERRSGRGFRTPAGL